MSGTPFKDPFDWFDAWFAEASQVVAPDPNAMTLATVDESGQPSIRVVLLKSWSREGFVFHTNRRSRKGRDIASTSRVALNFYWRELGHQIRIEGVAELLDDAASDTYFTTRDRGSQLGAWASLQSEALDSPSTFDERLEQFEAKYDGQEVPRPPHWGGYQVVPTLMEFWSAGNFRLHDRWVFRRDAGTWESTQLYP